MARLIKNAEMNTLISKIIMSIFIAVFGVTVFLPFTQSSGNLQVSEEMTVVGTVSAFLAVLLFLIVIMGLQVSTSFFSSEVVNVLSPLPLSKKDISRVALLCFVRVFDVPLVIAIAGFPIAYVFFSRSVLGGLAALLAVGITEIFALALTTGLAKFFYSRISTGSGRSKWKGLLRIVLMLVWILPSFGAYVVINFWMEIVQFFASLTQTVVSLSYSVVVLYPFSLGFLVSYASFFRGIDLTSLTLSIAASLGYLAVAVNCARWVGGTIRKLGTGIVSVAPRESVKDTLIMPQVPWLGIIRKDLRIASRSPSYASIFLLPAIQTVILAFSFSSFGDLGLSEMLGLLTGMSLMTVLLPPTLFAIEGLASAYTRSLPLKSRTLIFAKTTLATLTYVISLFVMLTATIYLGRDTTSVLIFGGIHALTVAAANMLEILLLAEKFWKEGSAIGNIYARLSTYILILIPGAIVVFMPIFAAIIMVVFAPELVLPVFLAFAASEFAIVTVATLRMNR